MKATLGHPLTRFRKPQAEAEGRAGDLLPVAAIGVDGTVVLDDGSFVHYVACTPPNQDSMDREAIEQAFFGFRGLAASLERGQTLQFQVEGDLLDVQQHMDFYRRQLVAMYGFDPLTPSEGELGELPADLRARWALHRMLRESVGRSAPEGFTMRRHCYLVVRYRPEYDLDPAFADALPSWMPGSRARVDDGAFNPRRHAGRRSLREHERLVRRATNRVRGLMNHLARDGISARLLDGAAVLRYLVARCNPTSATWGRLETETQWANVLSRFDTPVEREQAIEAAHRLRSRIAASPLDFRRDIHRGEVEQHLVRTGYLAGQPSSTRPFWLKELLQQPVPFTLSVFLHGLARTQVQGEMTRSWHQAQRENERRAKRGRRDANAERQEVEQEQLVEEMADDPQAGLVELSLYLSQNVPGPAPNANELEEAAHHTAQVVHRATAGGILMPGTREQEVLWRSTLPLGVDFGRKTLRFGMDHAADTIPFIGSSCGSPEGLPLFVSPMGEIGYLNPFDRAHRNHSIVMAGRSGTGKTHVANRLLGHLVALGAHGYVFDRAGHYRILAQLIPGARTIEIGSDDSAFAINHWDAPDPWQPGKQKVRFLIDLHRVMLDLDLTRMQEALLAHCIRATYLHCASNGIVPRERELYAFIRAYAEHERETRGGDDTTVATLDGLAAEMAEFVDEGVYANLWDRETNIPSDAPLLVFDSSGAGDRMMVPLMFATMEWVRERVRRRRAEAAAAPIDGSALHGRSVVLLDEGWSWAQVPELATHIQTWARQSRHLGTCFVVMSQDYDDFEGTAQSVLRNASIVLLFEQDKGGLEYLQRKLDVAPEVVRQLKDLRTVTGEYAEALLINGSRGSGIVRIITGLHEYWAFTSEPIHDQVRRDQAIERCNGNVWTGIALVAGEEGFPHPDAARL